ENVFLTNVLVEGEMNVSGNTDLGIDGTVVNDGVITLNGGGSQIDLEVQSGAIFAGSGELVLASPLAGINGSGNLLNDSGNTIRGEGNIGRNVISITNDGFIIADVPGQELVLNPATIFAGPEFVNNGTLLATDGGILVFDGVGNGEFLNNNEITVANGGQILFRNNAQLTNANAAASDRLIGGTFRAFDDGSGTTFDIVPPDFDLETIEMATVEIQGPNITSNLFDDDASSAGDLVGFNFRENGGTFIIGGGTDLTVNYDDGMLDGELTSFVNNFDDGAGNVDVGTFFVDAGTTVSFLDPDASNGQRADFLNTGSAVLGGGGTLRASVSGDGIYRPGNSNGTVGTLTIDNAADVADISGARLEIGLFEETSFDELVFTGDATVDNLSIAVDPQGSYLPNPGDAFEVVSTDGLTSSSNVNAFQDSGLIGLDFLEIVDSDSITIVADNLLVADANYDGVVNLQDFLVLRANFNSGDEYTEGDFNFDGVVNLADFLLLRENFGTGIGGIINGPIPGSDIIGEWGRTVPEPSAMLGLTALGGLALRRRRLR
ncbi:MAG: dockerin type I domain-containing protein, partial [Planctomycetota bacterium]